MVRKGEAQKAFKYLKKKEHDETEERLQLWLPLSLEDKM